MTAIHEEGAPRNSRAFLIVFLAFLSAFGPFVTDFYLPTLPDQTVDFGAPASMVQLGLSATMWGLAAGQLWIGPLSDTRGRRIPLAASLAVFSRSRRVQSQAARARPSDGTQGRRIGSQGRT